MFLPDIGWLIVDPGRIRWRSSWTFQIPVPLSCPQQLNHKVRWHLVAYRNISYQYISAHVFQSSHIFHQIVSKTAGILAGTIYYLVPSLQRELRLECPWWRIETVVLCVFYTKSQYLIILGTRCPRTPRTWTRASRGHRQLSSPLTSSSTWKKFKCFRSDYVFCKH